MNTCKYIKFAFGLGLFPHLTSGYCPSGWLSFESSCYDFVDQQLIWPEASHTCQAMHSELVTIDDALEYLFIHKHLIQLHSADVSASRLVSYWTSGNDIAQEGTWVWGNNEEMEFTYWWPGEPYQHRYANCLALQSHENFMFNDDSCNAKNRFICEISNTTGGVIVG